MCNAHNFMSGYNIISYHARNFHDENRIFTVTLLLFALTISVVNLKFYSSYYKNMYEMAVNLTYIYTKIISLRATCASEKLRPYRRVAIRVHIATSGIIVYLRNI
jgi:hypothetical protein